MVSRASRRLFMLYSPQTCCPSWGYAGHLSDLHSSHFGVCLCCLASGAYKHQSQQIERVQKRTVKTAVANRSDELVLKFGQQVLKSDRHHHLLPDQRSTNYNLRQSNTFPSSRCKTGRYLKSTIPFIINQFNNSILPI